MFFDVLSKLCFILYFVSFFCILPFQGPMVLNMDQRKIHYLNVSKNIQLLSSDKKSAKVVDLKLTEPQNKPLVVLLTWLMSKKPHIVKYAEFYSERGFDIMSINISPWQLLWPARGTQVKTDIINFVLLGQDTNFHRSVS